MTVIVGVTKQKEEKCHHKMPVHQNKNKTRSKCGSQNQSLFAHIPARDVVQVSTSVSCRMEPNLIVFIIYMTSLV